MFSQLVPFETYTTFLWIMAAVAVVVFVALYFVEAGYGYLFNPKFGFPVPNKVAWVMMECPVFKNMDIFQTMRKGNFAGSDQFVFRPRISDRFASFAQRNTSQCSR